MKKSGIFFSCAVLAACAHQPTRATTVDNDAQKCEQRQPSGFKQTLADCWTKISKPIPIVNTPNPPNATRLREEIGPNDSVFVDFSASKISIPKRAVIYKLKTLREVDSIIGSLKCPRPVTVRIVNQHSADSAVETDGSLKTGLNSVGPGQLNGMNRDPGLAREFGRLIFNANFYDLLLMHPKVAGNLYPQRLQKISSENESAPYQELFSDWVAVLHSNQPSAVSDYLRHSADAPLEPIQWQSRDFAAAIPIANWALKEKHELFGPTRSFIGKTLWKADLSLEARGHLAEKLMSAMVEEFADFYEQNVLADSLTPAELNRRLIQRLK